LVGELTLKSDAFAALWSKHPVHNCLSGRKRFHHPEVGDLELEFELLHLPDDSGHRILTYRDPWHALRADTTAPRRQHRIGRTRYGDSPEHRLCLHSTGGVGHTSCVHPELRRTARSAWRSWGVACSGRCSAYAASRRGRGTPVAVRLSAGSTGSSTTCG
jgi:hypothetical protein